MGRLIDQVDNPTSAPTPDPTVPPTPGPLTVFAPSNEAFDKLGPELSECLSQPENVLVLQDILTYHYTYGKVLAEDLTNNQVIMMANGKDIKITFIPGGVIINDNRQ